MTAPSAFVSLRQMQQGVQGQVQPQRGPVEDTHTTQRLSGTVLHAQGGLQTSILPDQLGATPVQPVAALSAPLAVTAAAPTQAHRRDSQVEGFQQHAADAAGES